jgi:hypothetical protein
MMRWFLRPFTCFFANWNHVVVHLREGTHSPNTRRHIWNAMGLTSVRPSYRRVSSWQLEKGEGRAVTLRHVRRACYQGVAMERSGNALLNLGARYCYFYDIAHKKLYNAVNQICQAFRRKPNNQTTSRTSHLLNLLAQWVPAQFSLSNIKIPAAETDIIDRGYRDKFFPLSQLSINNTLLA